MSQGICRSCKSFKKNNVFSFHIKKSQRRYLKSKIKFTNVLNISFCLP